MYKECYYDKYGFSKYRDQCETNLIKTSVEKETNVKTQKPVRKGTQWSVKLYKEKVTADLEMTVDTTTTDTETEAMKKGT